MSLQAWYPLNGHTNNYGVGDYPVTATNMTYSKEAMSGGDMVWDTNHNLFNKVKDLTICFWIYINENTGQHSNNILIGDDDSGTNRQYSIFTWSTSNDLHVSTPGGSIILPGKLPSYKWTHCAILFSATGGCVVYLNGTIAATFSHTPQTFNQITHVCRTTSTRLIRDLRFYDEALSPKIIKEISKGLILHIPCNQPERIANLATKAIITAGNSGFDTYEVDMPAVHCIAAASHAFAGIKLPSSLFTAGSTYVLTYDFIDHTGTTTCVGGYSASFTTLEYYVDGVKSNKQYSDPQPIANPYVGKRTHVYVYLKYNGTSNTDMNLYIQPGRGQDNVKKDFTVTNIRLSQTNGGDIPWAPPADMPSCGDTEYDCSGMGYNMKPYLNAPEYIEYSAGRYRCCYRFYGRKGFIYQNKDAAKPTDAITLSVWMMQNTLASGAEQDLLSSFDLGGAAIYAVNGGVAFSIFVKGGYHIIPSTSMNITTNEWHHIVGTYDGTTEKLYIDGELKASAALSGPITYNVNTGWAIGGNPCSNGKIEACYYNGYLSDCRIYSTALSAEDVKELYQQSASLTNNGILMSYDFQEKGVVS